jgi:hypothetical protein
MAYHGHDGAVARSREVLDALIKRHDEARASGVAIDDASLRTLREQIDRVARQKDAHLSGLFWHTELDEALSEARARNLPVLSLRLLGRLDEELSCANSRFFRAILYSDPAISSLLRERFVLHWESLRPVPVLTVDFGDGRSFNRTVTGNSIHYVLAPDGRVIDALPGLIAPRVFERELDELARSSSAGFDPATLREHHRRTMVRLRAQLFTDTDVALPRATHDRLMSRVVPAQTRGPSAIQAGKRAMSKIQIEAPLLRQLANPMPALAEDTRLNMTELRPVILGWLSESDVASPFNLDAFNGRVYAQLFLTPLDDPWMGLDVPDAFSGLPSPR